MLVFSGEPIHQGRGQPHQPTSQAAEEAEAGHPGPAEDTIGLSRNSSHQAVEHIFNALTDQFLRFGFFTCSFNWTILFDMVLTPCIDLISIAYFQVIENHVPLKGTTLMLPYLIPTI